MSDLKRMSAISHLTGFRGLWLSRRDGQTVWTVTYFDGSEMCETDDFTTWREAMDDFIRRVGLHVIAEIA